VSLFFVQAIAILHAPHKPTPTSKQASVCYFTLTVDAALVCVFIALAELLHGVVALLVGLLVSGSSGGLLHLRTSQEGRG